jgi:hypothetical protein
VLATLASQQRDALVMQVGGNLGRVVADGRIHRHTPNKSWPIAEPLRTVHGTLDRGLVVRDRENAVPRGLDTDALTTPDDDQQRLPTAPAQRVPRRRPDGQRAQGGAQRAAGRGHHSGQAVGSGDVESDDAGKGGDEQHQGGRAAQLAPPLAPSAANPTASATQRAA